MNRLRLTSCMAPIMDPMVAALAGYLSEKLELRVEPVLDRDWRARDEKVRRGAVELAWICGLPYVWMKDRGDPIELLTGPVMAGPRYTGRAIYFSDIVVARGAGIRSIRDLQGKRWAYNEPGSHSGYNVARVWLDGNGCGWDYFGEVWEAGTHSQALRWIIQGLVDAAAIDTTVLDWEIGLHPELGRQIEVIDTVGPSPMPPWIALKSVPPELRRDVSAALADMKSDLLGRQIMGEFGLSAFTTVGDGDYDLIRRRDQQARRVGPPPVGILRTIAAKGG